MDLRTYIFLAKVQFCAIIIYIHLPGTGRSGLIMMIIGNLRLGPGQCIRIFLNPLRAPLFAMWHAREERSL